MNVWIRKTRKRTTCACGCGKAILNGEFQVVCQWYMKLKSGRVWQKRKSYKPQHGIDQGIAEVEKRVVVETRGWGSRPRVPDTDKPARFAILRRRGAVVQRIKREVEMQDGERSMDRIIHLGEMLNKLRDEIEPLGGVPKSWL